MSKKRDKELIEYLKRHLTGLETVARENAGEHHSPYTVGAMSGLFDHVLRTLSDTGERFNTLSLIKQPRPAVPGINTLKFQK